MYPNSSEQTELEWMDERERYFISEAGGVFQGIYANKTTLNMQSGGVGCLEPDMRARSALNFDMFIEELKAYKKEYKDLLIPTTESALGQKVKYCRSGGYHCGHPERIQALNDIGFIWEAMIPTHEMNTRESFNKFIEDLKEYKAEHGHLLVPLRTPLGYKVSRCPCSKLLPL